MASPSAVAALQGLGLDPNSLLAILLNQSAQGVASPTPGQPAIAGSSPILSALTGAQSGMTSRSTTGTPAVTYAHPTAVPTGPVQAGGAHPYEDVSSSTGKTKNGPESPYYPGYYPGDYVPGIGILNNAGVVGVKQEALENGYFTAPDQGQNDQSTYGDNGANQPDNAGTSQT